MTITTMEELEALPVGERVQVQSNALGRKMWDRVEGGLQADDGTTVLELGMFVGALADSRVRNGDPRVPEVGGVYATPNYSDHRYLYVVVEVDSANQSCLCLYYRRRDFREVVGRTFRQMEDLRFVTEDMRQDWVPMVAAIGTEWMQSRRALVDIRSELRRLAVPTE